MGKPRVLPIREHRHAAVSYLVRRNQSATTQNWIRETVDKQRLKLLSTNDQVDASIAATGLGAFLLLEAISRLLAGDDAGGREQLAQALAVGFLGAELQKHARERR